MTHKTSQHLDDQELSNNVFLIVRFQVYLLTLTFKLP